MLLRMLLTIFIALTATSCGPRYVDYFPRHDDGTCKPCVAFIPLKDCSKTDLPWNVSEELNECLKYKIRDNADLYLMPTNTITKIMNNLGDVDYFGKDLSFSQGFCNCEFLVVMELIEHTTVPYVAGTITPLYHIQGNKCNSVLKMKVRLRIIDIRDEKPRIVLQEIVESNHMIAREYEGFNYNKEQWGSGGFCRTPIGLAHQRLVKDITTRIETITWSAR